MKPEPSTAGDIRSIRNALWMIVAILLIQLGLNLRDLQHEQFAEVIMLFGFWAGIFILIFKFVRMLVGQVVRLAETAKEEDSANRQ